MEDGFDDERAVFGVANDLGHEHGKAGGGGRLESLDGVLDVVVRWKGFSTPPPEKPERCEIIGTETGPFPSANLSNLDPKSPTMPHPPRLNIQCDEAE